MFVQRELFISERGYCSLKMATTIPPSMQRFSSCLSNIVILTSFSRHDQWDSGQLLKTSPHCQNTQPSGDRGLIFQLQMPAPETLLLFKFLSFYCILLLVCFMKYLFPLLQNDNSNFLKSQVQGYLWVKVTAPSNIKYK